MAQFGEEHNRFDLIPEYVQAKPTNSNKVWLTPDGPQKAGVTPRQETDLDRLRKEREPLDISSYNPSDTK